MRATVLTAALAAVLSATPAPAQSTEASPEVVAESPGLDINQVDFRLLRVISEQEYGTDPDAFDRLEANTAEGEPLSLPVNPDPLLRITHLDRAVIRQDTFGLYHLDAVFNEEDAAAYADITADHVGQRVIWTTHDSILADLLIAGREESGGFSIFYGDSPLERIENVLRTLQVSHTLEVAEDLIEPTNREEELRLAAMRELQLHPNAEGRAAAIEHLILCLEEGGQDYEYRPQVLFVLGNLMIQQGDLATARECLEQIRRDHRDFVDMVETLRALRLIAASEGLTQEVVTLNRTIVQMTAGRGPAALEAQRQNTLLLWASEPPSPDTPREVQRMINMLQDHIAGLPRAERFELELELILNQARLGATDDAMRTARGCLADPPEGDGAATVQLFAVCQMLAAADHIPEALELVEEYAERFEQTHDVEAEEIQPLWRQIQSAEERLRAIIEAPSEID